MIHIYNLLFLIKFKFLIFIYHYLFCILSIIYSSSNSIYKYLYVSIFVYSIDIVNIFCDFCSNIIKSNLHTFNLILIHLNNLQLFDDTCFD